MKIRIIKQGRVVKERFPDAVTFEQRPEGVLWVSGDFHFQIKMN